MRSKLHLILVAMIVISPSAFAGINRWTSNGPQGGSVNALVVDPADDATVYATTDRGVYKSENSGTLWKPMTNGMSDLSVSALTISPEDHAALYAGTSRGAVFKTVDGGQHWSELSRPTDGSIRAFAMSRDVIHAGSARRRARRAMDHSGRRESFERYQHHRHRFDERASLCWYARHRRLYQNRQFDGLDGSESRDRRRSDERCRRPTFRSIHGLRCH